MLPIVHATTEELAIYLYAEILNGLDANYLGQRGLHTMEVTVAEAPGQEATFRLPIPQDLDSAFKLDVREFIIKGDVIPIPCVKPETKSCCPSCVKSRENFTSQLEHLAISINNGTIAKGVTLSDLEQLLETDSKGSA